MHIKKCSYLPDPVVLRESVVVEDGEHQSLVESVRIWQIFELEGKEKWKRTYKNDSIEIILKCIVKLHFFAFVGTGSIPYFPVWNVSNSYMYTIVSLYVSTYSQKPKPLQIKDNRLLGCFAEQLLNTVVKEPINKIYWKNGKALSNRVPKLNFEIIPKERIFRFLPKIFTSYGWTEHGWSWKLFFANFHILGPLGCLGWVVIHQNVKKLKSLHPNLEYHRVCTLVRFATPSTTSECAPPLEPKRGHIRRRVWVGGPNSGDWKKSSALCLLCGLNPNIPQKS